MVEFENDDNSITKTQIHEYCLKITENNYSTTILNAL